MELGKDFPTLKQLANHINIHNRKGAHLCQTCGKQFTLPENLRRHQRIHAGIRPYQCHLCNRQVCIHNCYVNLTSLKLFHEFYEGLTYITFRIEPNADLNYLINLVRAVLKLFYRI